MKSRRRFLQGAAAAAAGSAVSFLFTRKAKAETFGPLVPDPDGILDLPAGFSYVVLQEAGDMMSDGYVVPRRPDGMGCFQGPAGTWILMRNHENSGSGGAYPAMAMAPEEAYDPAAMGGVTRVVVSESTLEVESSNLVLTGTLRNCAGGHSPWGWLTCEENVDPEHGYVFVCDANASTVQMPERVPAYGRFNHEAAVVDPANLYAYLTEDRDPSAFYRFVPDDPGEPFVGQLQALRVVDNDGFDTGTMSVGDTVDIEWVDIDEPDPVGDTVRTEAFAAGAAVIHRGEGLWFADDTVYICSTNGGPASAGQIFALRDTAEGPELELLAVSTGRDELDMPDNITVAPWGDLYLAEDGLFEQFIRILEPDGSVSDFAKNAISNSELAGVCFSPDGSTLFVNIQGNGLTLAIRGPFPGSGIPPFMGDIGPGLEPDASVPFDAGLGAPFDGGMGPAGDDGCGCSTPGAGDGRGAALGAAALAALAARRVTEPDD